MRLTIIDKESFVKLLNSFLPEDIRLFTMTKVTKNFDAKNLCSKRRYQYLLPTYVLENVDDVLGFLETAFAEQGAIIGAGYEGGFADPKSKSFLGNFSIKFVICDLGESLSLCYPIFVMYVLCCM